MSDQPGALADLHRHLDGSLRAPTLEALAKAQGRSLPRQMTFRPGTGLEEALARFRRVLDLLQRPEDVGRVAAEACEDAAAEGVTTLELRLAPQLHRGAGPAEVIDAALAGIAGRAGLVLCGIYGESPRVLEELVGLAAARPGVVGIDLAGAPDPAQRWIMEDYRHAYRQAAELGLGRTVHAAEGRPAEEASIAIEVLGAQRLGQATGILEDPDVVALARERGVVIELCLTSALATGAVPLPGPPPLRALLDAGLLVTLGTDSTFFCATDARREHAQALRLPGVTSERLAAVVATGHAAAFRRGHTPAGAIG